MKKNNTVTDRKYEEMLKFITQDIEDIEKIEKVQLILEKLRYDEKLKKIESKSKYDIRDKYVHYMKDYVDKKDDIEEKDFYLFINQKVNYDTAKKIFMDNFSYYLDLNEKTLVDIVNDLNLPYSTVRDWANGKNFPRPDKLQLLADYFHISPNNLTSERTSAKVPVLGNIPAGIPMEAIEYIDDWEEIPATWLNSDKQYFGLKIKGNSMYPNFQDGDIVIFQRASNCDNGKNCAVMIENSDVTFKKLIKTEAGLILQPLNDKEFEPMFFSNKDVLEKNIKIIGIPKEIRRKLD